MLSGLEKELTQQTAKGEPGLFTKPFMQRSLTFEKLERFPLQGPELLAHINAIWLILGCLRNARYAVGQGIHCMALTCISASLINADLPCSHHGNMLQYIYVPLQYP